MALPPPKIEWRSVNTSIGLRFLWLMDLGKLVHLNLILWFGGSRKKVDAAIFPKEGDFRESLLSRCGSIWRLAVVEEEWKGGGGVSKLPKDVDCARTLRENIVIKLLVHSLTPSWETTILFYSKAAKPTPVWASNRNVMKDKKRLRTPVSSIWNDRNCPWYKWIKWLNCNDRPDYVKEDISKTLR